MDSRIQKLQTIIMCPLFSPLVTVALLLPVTRQVEGFGPDHHDVSRINELRQLGLGGFRLLNNLGSGFGCQCLDHVQSTWVDAEFLAPSLLCL